MLEALNTSAANAEAVKSQLKLILPLYFYRYKPEYEAILDTIIFSGLGEKQEEMLSTYNTVPRLHEISCPTLILVGRDDFICPPSQAQIMYEHIPQSHLVVFEHSGHFPCIEEHEPFDRAVRAWLAQ